MTLVIFIGLQGCGKSTFYRLHFSSTGATYVSKDQWPNAKKREARQRRIIHDSLSQGLSVVVDNTNPSPAERLPLLAIGQEYGARLVGYFFEIPLETALARNAQRKARARVPDVAIYATHKRLTPPSPDEGFHEIYHVRPKEPFGYHIIPWDALPPPHEKESTSSELEKIRQPFTNAEEKG